MGEAKRRGSYEQRKHDGIIRKEAERSAREQRDAEREQAKSPEQRRKERNTRVLLATLLAVSAGLHVSTVPDKSPALR